MIGKERCRGGGFRSSKLAVIWCSPLKGTLSQPLWEENPARVHDPPYIFVRLDFFFVPVLFSLSLCWHYLLEVMSATDLSPTRQIGCDMTGFFFVPHTPTTLTVAPRSCCFVYIYLHAAVETSHIHYSSAAEAVYKVSSINCLLLGVRTCGDMQ